jgi:hypothetical protein
LAEAKSHLTRPWLGGTLNTESVRTALGAEKTKEEKIQNALLISEQIGPILAAGTRGNPRQVKRFLNTLLLRQASAQARGFGDDVKLPVLAKLMLAERFNSRVFDQIATISAGSAHGTCQELMILENLVRAKAKGIAPEENREAAASEGKRQVKRGQENETQQSTIAKEWVTSESAQEWARLRPPLAKLDLRPYLFVAKDRKDYFGTITLLGQIAAIAEKLLGPKIAVQKEEPSLRQLALPEAAQVFDSLRSLIVATDSFKTSPKGADGMEVLVRAQPQLQNSLLDFLESLPADRLGAWVGVRHATVIPPPSGFASQSRMSFCAASHERRSSDFRIILPCNVPSTARGHWQFRCLRPVNLQSFVCRRKSVNIQFSTSCFEP